MLYYFTLYIYIYNTLTRSDVSRETDYRLNYQCQAFGSRQQVLPAHAICRIQRVSTKWSRDFYKFHENLPIAQ